MELYHNSKYINNSYADVEIDFCQAYRTSTGASKRGKNMKSPNIFVNMTTPYTAYNLQIKCVIKCPKHRYLNKWTML